MWDIFISHANEDKEAVARPLAEELTRRGCRVWYEDFTLKLGDGLRRSIDAGLRDSRFGVVILSHSFFEKQWPQRQLDGLTARETTGEKVILPVWHEVTRADVLRFSPVLADRLGVETTHGVRAVADKIEEALRSAVGISVLGSTITPGEARALQETALKSARQRWKELDYVAFPTFSDSEHSRTNFVFEIARSLDDVFNGRGFQRFVALLCVEQRQAMGQTVNTYTLSCHQGGFIETLRRRGNKFIVDLFSAKEAGTPEAKQQLQERMENEDRDFRWRVQSDVEFSEELSPVELRYDPDARLISLKSLPLSLDPSDYPNRVATTSEALTYVASATRLSYAFVGEMGFYVKNYALMKLLIELLDRKGIDFGRLRVNAQDLEEWDYDNPALDEEIGRWSVD